MLPRVLSSPEAFSLFENWKVEQQALHVVSTRRPPYKYDVVIRDVLTDSEKLMLVGCLGSIIDKYWDLKGAKFTYELPSANSKNTFDVILTVNLASGELLLFGKRV
jgi:hypothetical protein